MDNNLIFAFLTLLIILITASLIDEAIILFILAFSVVSITYNLETLFTITASSYSNFGKLLILSYYSAAVFCLAKAALTGYAGIAIIRKRNV